ncbi:PqqD family protein [Rhodobacter sp. SY28-1]|uniref:PqqD family protein n=1 Tax=Rhodobacter sp. SY28-1 TaxID=2562317 RepID=UPI0014855AF8|nr:PqqD family protein [Rhodobacter sp. SY28-1]
MAGTDSNGISGTEGETLSVPDLCEMHFAGVPSPVVLPDDPSVLHAFDQCIVGWPYRRVPLSAEQGGSTPPLCVIEPRGQGRFRAHSRYLDEPLDNLFPATAICVVLADLSQAYSDLTGDHVFGLHCGGVLIGGRGVILAGERRAGKSTLVARLSSEAGTELLGDDVLPVVADGSVVGLGLAPRLRLPLPDTATPHFTTYVKQWLGPFDDRYGYLLTPALAPHGRRVKAEALILLDRRPAAPAALHALPADELLRTVVERSIAGPVGPEAMFDAARELSSRLVGLRLVYSDLDEAAALLLGAFPADGRNVADAVAVAQPIRSVPSATHSDPGLAPSVRCRRSVGTATRRIGDAAFLWRVGDGMLWHLNPTAQAIWSLLARPTTARTIARHLSSLFPNEPSQSLLEDTMTLLGRLAEEGFVDVRT